MNVITQLTQVLKDRQSATDESSYVASLYAAGLNKILEKVGEEATEVILASRDLAEAAASEPDSAKPEPSDNPSATESALVGEVADLWFHTMVMLTHQGVPPTKVLDELARRFGVSGIEEKLSR